MRFARLPRALLLSLFATAGSLCFAPPGLGALSYNLGLGAGVESTDNVNLSSDDSFEGGDLPLGSSVVTYSASVILAWQDRGDTLDLTYDGDYVEFHGEGQALDSEWIHRADAALDWRRWSPFFLQIRESRDRVQQYRDEREVEIRNRTERNVLVVRPGFAWDIGRTGRLEIAVRGEQQTFPGEAEGDDLTGLHGEIGFTRRWTPLWSSGLRLEYGDVRHEIGPNLTLMQAGVEVSQRITPFLDASYSLAWRQDRSSDADGAEAGGASRSHLIKGVGLNGRAGRNLSWSVTYGDRIESLVDGETLRAGRFSGECAVQSRLGSSFGLGVWHEQRDFLDSGGEDRAWGPTADARWRMTEWAALEFGGRWTRTTREEGGAEFERSELASADAGVVLLFLNHIQIEAGYRRRWNSSTLEERSYRSNNWYLVGTAYLKPFLPGQFP